MNIMQYISDATIKFMINEHGDKIANCKSVDDLQFNNAFTAIRCAQYSPIKIKHSASIGVEIARETARIIKDEWELLKTGV
jgi:hypothetical protein